jgi:hypothetical protein
MEPELQSGEGCRLLVALRLEGFAMSANADDALDVLREVWRSSGQRSVELDDATGGGKSCKKMQDVGFDDFAAGEADLRAAWRARLEREGKLARSVGSLRDLVLGQSEPAPESRLPHA